MKNYFLITSLIFALNTNVNSQVRAWIRVNQLGYLPNDKKAAILLSEENITIKSFSIYNALTDELEYKSDEIIQYGNFGNFKSTFRLNFSNLREEGSYKIKIDSIESPVIRIFKNAYDGSANFLLNYMRQQRCGYNPILNDSCHTSDGFIIYHPALDSTHIDATGGWHDASDYLQYVTTSANAVYLMLFAYEQNQNCFSDEYENNGIKKANGIPDILDEAKWGIDWLLKMNPKADEMYNQIADDRDHRGFRLPNEDTISYGKGLERPVYYCTGKPQGMFRYKNRSDGIASTAGKFASAFALGSEVFKKYFTEYAEKLKQKAIEAYDYGKRNPGVCQTAPCISPYFYEEENWVDDMQLAAASLYKLTGEKKFLDDAITFGRQERTTPWMGADTAKHYQWYPFINLGHFVLAQICDDKNRHDFIEFLQEGIEKVYLKSKDNPFLFGVPFIWCSNNLVAAMLTQCHLYKNLTGDTTYEEMELSLRDWLFGCNPWGTSMVIGLPEYGDYPVDPHSAFTHLKNIAINGGLVDGPVYTSIYQKLLGIKLYAEDEYKIFQSNIAVYHDDYGDYSTNEPTMDGTASLTYYLSAMQRISSTIGNKNKYEIRHGAVVRTDKSKKQINLVFTGHDFGDGLEVVYKTLKKHEVHASFFFTGDFYRNKKFTNQIQNLVKDGHYLGAHSNKHLLFASWTNRDSTLLTKKDFFEDIKLNYQEMKNFNINPRNSKIFLPAFEWYNNEISMWCKELGLVLVCHSSGTDSNQDWTYPELGIKYVNNTEIFESILAYESSQPDGLNGFILLLHVGADDKRPEKFYNKLDELITQLKKRGYVFTLLSETI